MIYGSGSTGREIADLARQIQQTQPRWNAIYFLDDLREATEHAGLRVLRMADLAHWPEPFECVVAIGEPAFRQAMFQRLEHQGFACATLVDPSARLSPSARLGRGCIVGHHAFVSSDTVLEDNVMLEINTIVGHDIVIGAHAVVSSCPVVGGAAQIGTRTFIGMNCTIKEKTRIGSDAIIGMQSAVFNDVPDGMVALGNPCRVLRKNETGRVFK